MILFQHNLHRKSYEKDDYIKIKYKIEEHKKVTKQKVEEYNIARNIEDRGKE